MTHFTDRPMAARGLTSYRYLGRYGPITIGARNDADALNEASRSICYGEPNAAFLQRWDGERYVHIQTLGQD